MTREEAVTIVSKGKGSSASLKFDCEGFINMMEALGLLTLDVAFKPTSAERRALDVFTEWSLPGANLIADLRKAGLQIVEKKSDG
ncbi:MAG: hypothetical protein KGJ21_09790 [Pseudomonadota bacterium]|nr:hypothetical protein [Pseudomonadota bacterium]